MSQSNVGTITYNAVINTSGLQADARNVENRIGGVATKIGAISGLVSVGVTKAMDLVSSSIGAAITRVDTLANAPKVLANLGFDANDSAKSIKKLTDNITGLPTKLDDIVSSQLRVAASSDYGIDKVTDLTVAFNNMALAGGKGSDDANRAFVQFTQSLARGKFQAQEFNTMMDVMPAQIKQVAQVMLGADANAQDLKQAFEDGAVTMDEFVDATIKLDKTGGANFASFHDQARDATAGIGTGIENMKTAITRGLVDIIKSIGQANIKNAIEVIGQAFEFVLKKVGEFIAFVVANQDTIKPIVDGIIDFGKQASEYLVPKLKELWDTLRTDLIPALQTLWRDVIEPLVPVIGVVFVGAIGLAIDAVRLISEGIGWFTKALQDGNPFIWLAVAAFGGLAAAMAFNAVFNALTTGFAVLRLVTIPSVMTSIGAMQAVILAPLVMPAIAVGAAIAALLLVKNAAFAAHDAINDAKVAAANLNTSQSIAKSQLQKLVRSGDAGQKARAQKALNSGIYDGYASGTNNATAGWHWVGEDGPELLNFKGGEQVMPNPAASMANMDNMLSDAANGGIVNHIGTINIAKEVDGENLLARITRNDGLISNGITPPTRYAV